MKNGTCAELLDYAHEHARRVLIDTQDEMTPISHLIRDDGEDIILGTPWRSNDEKQMTLRMLAALMRAGNVIRYMVMCEAWFALAKPDETGDILAVMPRDNPDRIEVVIATAVERGGSKTRVWEIKRGAYGNCVDLVEMARDATFDGPWLELLPMDA